MADRRPLSVKVGGHQYTIRYGSPLQDRVTLDTFAGRVMHNTGVIEIDDGRSHTQQAETFLHEVIHSISANRDINLDERQVDQTGAGLLAFIVDNPEVFGEQFMNLWKQEEGGSVGGGAEPKPGW